MTNTKYTMSQKNVPPLACYNFDTQRLTDLTNTEHVDNRQQVPRSCLVHPVDRFDSEGWFSSDQVIFLTVFCVFC